jgi:hypothetical protein
MNKKYISIGVLIIMVFIFFYMGYLQINRVDPTQIQVQQNKSIPNNDEKNNQSEGQTKLSIDLKDKHQTSHIKNNATGLETETYIGKQIIISKYQDCIIYLRYKIGSTEFKESILYSTKSNKAQIKIIARHHFCYEMSQKHPEYQLNNPYLLEIGSDQTITTHLEKALDGQESYEYDEIQGNQLIAELNQADATLLMHPRIYFFLVFFHDNFTSKELMKITHSQDPEYIYIMLTYAQTQYNCNKNGGCDGSSPTMIEVCSNDEIYCDLDNYNTFLYTHLTKGQQADLKLIYQYIENLFENQ